MTTIIGVVVGLGLGIALAFLIKRWVDRSGRPTGRR